MLYRISALPPSVNAIYAVSYRKGAKDRYRTKKYDDWLSSTARELAPVTPIKGEKYRLDVLIPWGMKHGSSDLDNFLKPISDLLVKNGASPDDKHCVSFSIAEADVPTIMITVVGV